MALDFILMALSCSSHFISPALRSTHKTKNLRLVRQIRC
ncbi:MAG: hypothetical protein ACI9V1_003041, partial [Spirosomataceae bacterium]